MRVPWSTRRSIRKEINHEYSLEGLMLKLQYFVHLMGRADSLENTLCWERLRQEEKRATEDEMLGWHHQLRGFGFKRTLRDSEGYISSLK